MKLIKLSGTHYIIVDDSEIKEGDWFVAISGIGWKLNEPRQADKKRSYKNNHCKKITHSTQPLETTKTVTVNHLVFYKIKKLSLSEVEEVIYGYSVKKIAENDTIKRFGLKNDELSISFCNGFKSAMELVKDKLFTVEDMKKAMRFIADFKSDFPEDFLNHYYEISNTDKLNDGEAINAFVQSLLPKTEWSIEFDEKSKIKLL